jgi:hypothetical protein
MAGHADKVILALFQFLACGIIQHKGDHLVWMILEEDSSH